MGLVRHAALVVWKDLVVELRSREVLYPTALFAAIVVLLCSFAFVRNGIATGDGAAGILWITVALAGTLGLGRAFEREREGDTMRALLLAPSARAAIYVGKLCGTSAAIVVIAALVAPLVALLFDAPLLAAPAPLATLILLGAIGFGAVGALFGAALLRSRARDVLLAVITYPLVVPVLIAGVKGTVALLPGGDVAESWFWARFLVVYDAVFIVLGLWVFEPLAAE